MAQTWIYVLELQSRGDIIALDAKKPQKCMGNQKCICTPLERQFMRSLPNKTLLKFHRKFTAFSILFEVSAIENRKFSFGILIVQQIEESEHLFIVPNLCMVVCKSSNIFLDSPVLNNQF